MLKRYVINYSTKNGLGRPSISIYLQGCDKKVKCKSCHNLEMQSPPKEKCNFYNMTKQLDNYIEQFMKFHKKLHMSFLGGEPLAPYNRDIVYKLSKYIKTMYKNSKISLYSWRTIKQINEELKSYIQYIDYGILGEYNESLYVADTLPSSSNQYIYDFKNKKIIEPIKLKRG